MNTSPWLRSIVIAAFLLALTGAWTAPKTAGPDLTIEQILVSSDGSTIFAEGNLFQYPEYPQFTVRNIGDASATGHWTATFRCKAVPNSGPEGVTPQLPTDAEQVFGAASSPVLAPGKPWTLWIHAPIKPLPAGKFILSARVELAEDTNKNNNYAEITITVNALAKRKVLNAVLVAPTLDKVEVATALVPTKVNLAFREHSVSRVTRGVIIERKSTSSGYELIAKTLPSGAQIDVGNGIARTYQDGPLNLGTYTYRMKAYDDKGESGYSNEMSVTIKTPAKLPLDKIIK